VRHPAPTRPADSCSFTQSSPDRHVPTAGAKGDAARLVQADGGRSRLARGRTGGPDCAPNHMKSWGIVYGPDQVAGPRRLVRRARRPGRDTIVPPVRWRKRTELSCVSTTASVLGPPGRQARRLPRFERYRRLRSSEARPAEVASPASHTGAERTSVRAPASRAPQALPEYRLRVASRRHEDPRAHRRAAKTQPAGEIGARPSSRNDTTVLGPSVRP
jgi:hypothetical protein